MLLAVGLNTARLGQLIVNLFAIAGAFLIGYVLAMGAGWLLERFLFGFKAGDPVRQAFRIVTGIALALLVAIIVFGHGEGWNLFGGGLEGDANQAGQQQTGTTAPNPDAATPTTPTTEPQTPPQPINAGPVPTERYRITMLGGKDVAEQKFYLVEDDLTPRNFAEVKVALAKKKELRGKPFQLEIRFAGRNTLAPNHGAVLQLSQWARESAGLSVTFPAEEP